ncbi:MAG: hypothetical protein GY904_13845 [Planctomycetaceae bacterium]|nr:hypothetical protein [Planctomycetaceae bacterium]
MRFREIADKILGLAGFESVCREPPQWLADALDELTTPRAKTIAYMKQDPTFAQASHVIPNGQQNATLAKLAGSMRFASMSEPETFAALGRYRRTTRLLSEQPLATDYLARSIRPLAVPLRDTFTLMAGYYLGRKADRGAVSQNGETWKRESSDSNVSCVENGVG